MQTKHTDISAKSKSRFSAHAKKYIGLFLAVALVITGLYAFLVAQDEKENVFLIGRVDVDLIEDFDINKDGEIKADGSETFTNTNPPVVNNVLPGDTIIKRPRIYNSGNDAWVYMCVAIPTAPIDEFASGVFGTPQNTQKVIVTAYAVQPQSGDNENASYVDVWDSLDVSLDGGAGPATSACDELFILNDISSDWQQIGDVYRSADGYNYYVYGIPNKIVKEATTPNLFDSVTLSPDIGEPAPHFVTFVSSGTQKTVPFINSASTVQIPDDADNWIAENGNKLAKNNIVAVSDLYDYKVDGLNFVVSNPDPIVTALSDVESKPKLMPVEGTSAIVVRDGVGESYQNSIYSSTALPRNVSSVIAPNTDKYSSTDFSNYYIYILGKNPNFFELGFVTSERSSGCVISDYFCLDDATKGSVEFVPARQTDGYWSGSNSKLIIKDTAGNIVEQFTYIIYNELEGDGWPTATDSSLLIQFSKGFNKSSIVS